MGTVPSVIARHIRNIYKEEELEEEGTYAKFAYMGHDGLQLYEVRAHGDRHAVTLIKRYRKFSGKSGGYFKEIVYLCSRVWDRGQTVIITN